ncbi:MAG TPA: helix-turn-helix domain-containing protein [Rhizomicrobium sp.]|jgi:excisionase family DNA binding protein|nr:helix-turn-helix domain-containing protein [Rhizomicrobium sp.]
MDLERDRTPINRKFIGRAAGGGHRVFVDASEQPFSKLDDEDLLDSTDLCAIFGVSSRTIYRWISEDDLPVHAQVGREYLFAKGDLLDWWDDMQEEDDD